MKATKLYIIVLLILGTDFSNSFAQSITLPDYQEGQYENDTIYTYYGSFPITGIGTINLGGTLASGFITGVDFKIVVDSINQGSSTTHTAFRDHLGTLVPVYQGDTLEIPTTFQLFAGAIGFHVIIEGTPQVAGESYLCDLGLLFTLGEDWGMIIQENTQYVCVVDQWLGLHINSASRNITVFPNPVNTTVMLQSTDSDMFIDQVTIYDIRGRMLQMVYNTQAADRLRMDVQHLPSGYYMMHLLDKLGQMHYTHFIKD